eukprot:364173-Chlamydomonas_euryale.AAC.7
MWMPAECLQIGRILSQGNPACSLDEVVNELLTVEAQRTHLTETTTCTLTPGDYPREGLTFAPQGRFKGTTDKHSQATHGPFWLIYFIGRGQCGECVSARARFDSNRGRMSTCKYGLLDVNPAQAGLGWLANFRNKTKSNPRGLRPPKGGLRPKVESDLLFWRGDWVDAENVKHKLENSAWGKEITTTKVSFCITAAAPRICLHGHCLKPLGHATASLCAKFTYARACFGLLFLRTTPTQSADTDRHGKIRPYLMTLMASPNAAFVHCAEYLGTYALYVCSTERTARSRLCA